MCIEHNRPCIILTKDLRKTYAWDYARAQDVFEHRTGADGRELIDIADKYDMCPGQNGNEQMLHEYNIHHRHFINNDNICLKLCLCVSCKTHLPIFPALRFQHAMNGRRRIARCLRKALCRTSRRCSQKDLHPLGPKDVNNAPDDRGLPRSGTAGQDQDTVQQRGSHGFPLSGCEPHMMMLFPCGDKRSGIIDVNAFCLALNHPKQTRRFLLRLIELRRIDEAFSHIIYRIEAIHLYRAAKHLHNLVSCNTKSLRRTIRKYPFGNAAMSAGRYLRKLIG